MLYDIRSNSIRGSIHFQVNKLKYAPGIWVESVYPIAFMAWHGREASRQSNIAIGIQRMCHGQKLYFVPILHTYIHTCIHWIYVHTLYICNIYIYTLYTIYIYIYIYVCVCTHTVSYWGIVINATGISFLSDSDDHTPFQKIWGSRKWLVIMSH